LQKHNVFKCGGGDTSCETTACCPFYSASALSGDLYTGKRWKAHDKPFVVSNVSWCMH